MAELPKDVIFRQARPFFIFAHGSEQRTVTIGMMRGTDRQAIARGRDTDRGKFLQ